MKGEDAKAKLLALTQCVSDGAEPDWGSFEKDLDSQVVADVKALMLMAAFHRSAKPDPSEIHPKTWGPLKIVEPVGSGGFGHVYRVWDPNLQREAALKLLRPERETDPAARRRGALREGRLLARVQHPNVATVYGADEHDGRVGIWMELIPGRNLEELVREHGTMSAAEAARIGVDLCRALAAVHSQGLIHRDVTARNVIRRQGGRIVLTDFGLGQSTDEARAPSGRVAGTPLYLPPEAFEGKAASARADIYSLGALLYFLVSGDFPVSGESVEDLARAHREGERVLLRDRRPGLPGWFVRAVEKALDPDPSRRFASVGQLELALAGDAPSHASAARWLALAKWWPALAVLVLAVALGLWTRTPGQAAPTAFAGIILTDLKGEDGASDLAGLDNWLRDQIDRPASSQLASRKDVEAASHAAGVDLGERLDAPEAVELAGRMFQTALVIEPEVFSSVDSRQLAVRIERAVDGYDDLRRRWSRSFFWPRGQSWTAIRSELADWLKARLVEAQAQTLYIEADKSQDEVEEGSIPKLKAVVEMDPDFALAWSKLGGQQVELGQFSEGYQNLARALELLQRRTASDPENAVFQREQDKALLFVLDSIEDSKGAEAHAHDYLRRWGKDLHGLFYLASAEAALGSFQEAVTTYREILKSGTNFNVSVQLTRLLLRLGRFEEADREIRLLEDLAKPPPWLQRFSAWLGAGDRPATVPEALDWARRLKAGRLFLPGDHEASLQLLAQPLSSKKSHQQSRNFAVRAYVLGELGRRREAIDVLEQGLILDRQNPEGLAEDKELALAYLRAKQGDTDYLKGLAVSGSARSLNRLGRLGFLLARAGLIDEAARILSQIQDDGSFDIPIYRRSRQKLEAEILIAQGNPAKGLDILRRVAVDDPAYYNREYLARAFTLAGEPETGLQIYQEYANSPGIHWSASVHEEYPGFYADTLLEYAKAAARLGERAQAKEALRRYLKLRGDSGLAETEEARKLLAGLQ